MWCGLPLWTSRRAGCPRRPSARRTSADLVHERPSQAKKTSGAPADLHLRDEDAAAVVLGRDLDALALLELRERLLDGGPQHRAGEEAQSPASPPTVAVDDGVKPGFANSRQPLVRRRQVAREAQRRRRLLGRAHDAGREQRRRLPEPARRAPISSARHLPHRRVPDEAGIDAADGDVAGHVVDGRLGHDDALSKRLPLPASASAPLRRALPTAAASGLAWATRSLRRMTSSSERDLLRVALLDREDRPHARQRQHLVEQPLVAARVDVAVIGGDVEVGPRSLMAIDRAACWSRRTGAGPRRRRRPRTRGRRPRRACAGRRRRRRRGARLRARAEPARRDRRPAARPARPGAPGGEEGEPGGGEAAGHGGGWLRWGGHWCYDSGFGSRMLPAAGMISAGVFRRAKQGHDQRMKLARSQTPSLRTEIAPVVGLP